ncbi:MAG: hypothetical protein SGI83_18570, partial [Bacteroidota bacterium]|nr:hypothetical protein [Bacteroidota bacterium]
MGNKVRNFYNNIANPNSENGEVTVDTHAAAVGFLNIVSAKDASSMTLLNSDKYGYNPLYAVLKEAYQEVARENGYTPREMQSISWEAIRLLIDESKKNEENRDAINKIWKDKNDKNITHEQATRSNIKKFTYGEPEWDRATNEGVDNEALQKDGYSLYKRDGDGGDIRGQRNEARTGSSNVAVGYGGLEQVWKPSSFGVQFQSEDISSPSLKKFVVGYAPFREGGIEKMGDSLKAFEDKKYKQWLAMADQFAKELGISLDATTKTVGVYGATSSKMEASSVVTIVATDEQAMVFAALMGTLAPDVQHSVMLNTYDESGEDVEHRVTFKDRESAESFLSNKNAYGVSDVSFEPDTNTALILDISRFNAIFDSDKFLKDYGESITGHKQNKVVNSFIEEQDYAGILQKERDSDGRYNKGESGQNLNDILKLAINRINRRSGDRSSLPQSAQEKLTERLNKTVFGYLDKFRKQFGLPKTMAIGRPVPFNAETSRKIFEAYSLLATDNSADPDVKAAYDQLVKEVDAQYRYLVDEVGLKVDFMENDPYEDSVEMMADVYDNNHLKVFKGGEPHPFLDARD